MMKTASALIFLPVCFAAPMRATDLIIDRIIIGVTPLEGTYYVAVNVEADKAKASYHVPGRPCKGNGIEIPVNLELKDVARGHWCRITMQLDKTDADAPTYKAVEKHTSRFQVGDSGTEVFIPYQNPNHSWIWKVVYRTK